MKLLVSEKSFLSYCTFDERVFKCIYGLLMHIVSIQVNEIRAWIKYRDLEFFIEPFYWMKKIYGLWLCLECVIYFIVRISVLIFYTCPSNSGIILNFKHQQTVLILKSTTHFAIGKVGKLFVPKKWLLKAQVLLFYPE